MKTLLLRFTFVAMFSVGSYVLADSPGPDATSAQPKFFGKRLWEAILPGLSHTKTDKYGYFYLALAEPIGPAQDTFKSRQDNSYLIDDNSPFVTDPSTPVGNVFQFRF